MSNQAEANATFARMCLRNLRLSLIDCAAISLCNQLDQAIRKHDLARLAQLSGSLPDIVRQDLEPWRIKEQIQAISLVRFPIWDLNEDEIVNSQRERVLALKHTRNPSDALIWTEAGKTVCECISTALSRLSPVGFKHGPGVVAETSDALKKRSVIFVDAVLQRYLGNYLPDNLGTYIRRPGISKTVLVPKDWKTLRVIAAEPTWTQWLQQGVKDALYKVIPNYPLFRGHISFEDQEVQRNLLRRPRIATIDLSDASDTLRACHTILLTKGNLYVREALMALRTHRTEWKGKLLSTIGMYPMGAAVCFPWETLCFASLLLAYSYAEVGHLPRNWGVFGDDIIVDDELAGGFCRFLERSGFKPNRNKTFIGGHFVESCGVYLYKGVNVTPTKIKKGAPKGSLDATNITYRQYISELRHYNHLVAALTSCLTDDPPVTRWNTKLQRLETSCLQPSQATLHGHEWLYSEALLRGSCDIPRGAHHVRRGWQPISR